MRYILCFLLGVFVTTGVLLWLADRDMFGPAYRDIVHERMGRY